MERNTFLIFNDLVYHLYTCQTLEEIKEQFVIPLRLLIPYSYASILLTDLSKDASRIFEENPLCVPERFSEAETEYIKRADEDPLLWMIYGKESTLICESELIEEKRRTASDLYTHCYRPYHIYDTLQFSIVYNQQCLGILTLFRTKADGLFNENDLFYFRSLGTHLNLVLDRIRHPLETANHSSETFSLLVRRHNLTDREAEILEALFAFQSNEEIAAALGIQDSTMQKHLQNIFRKMNVSSKWELLKFR